jgi:hypothetical protein
MKLALPNLELIEEQHAKDLVAEGALTGATVLGQPNGWVIIIHCGSVGWAIAATATVEPRLWADLDSASIYAVDVLCLNEFRVDIAEKGRDAVTRRLVDKAEQNLRMRQAAGYQALRMRYYPYRDSQ